MWFTLLLLPNHSISVVSPEKVEIDLVTRRNSAYIHWKRPGMKSLRKEASLEPDVGQHTAQSDITRPPIPQEELKRFMTMIEHAGQALDQVSVRFRSLTLVVMG